MSDFVDAMIAANKLWMRNRPAEALTLLQANIAKAEQTSDATWLRLHACLIARDMNNPSLVENYCDQILRYEPENVLAIYNLADAALLQGRADLSARYALRAYSLITQSSPEKDRVLMDLLTERWPEIERR
jgi:hypothetical protein